MMWSFCFSKVKYEDSLTNTKTQKVTDHFNIKKRKTEWSRLEDGRERRKLDLSLPGKWNGDVTKERKINGQTQIQLVVDVPISTNVFHQAHQYAVRHLHRHLQHRLLIPRQWPWVLHLPWRYHPASPHPTTSFPRQNHPDQNEDCRSKKEKQKNK